MLFGVVHLGSESSSRSHLCSICTSYSNKKESRLPVENVEESVETKCGHIMRGNIFDESDFIEHNDLRYKCY
jgi:hypothetical protein